MPTLTTYDDLELAVSTYGREDADLTVLLAHCWTSDQDVWRYQVRDLQQLLGDRVRIVAWDHRGHGLSSPTPRADCTIANLATDMADVVATFAPRGDLVLAGHSIGGMTIMALAEQAPEVFERVRGVAFVATSSGDLESVTLGMPDLGPLFRAQIPRVLAVRARTWSKRARRRSPTIERQVMSRLVFGRPQRVRDVALAIEALVNCPPATVVGFYEDCMRHERTDALKALHGIPTRVLVGTADLLTPPRMAKRIAGAADGVLTTVPGAGHMLPLERDELVTATIADLVGGALRKPGGGRSRPFRR